MKTILTVVITAVMTLMLFGGNRAPVQAVQVKAQSADPRGDLVTLVRQDVGNFNAAMDSFIAHRAEWAARNVTFVAGDLKGSNSGAGFVAADVTQAMTDFNTIITAVRSGGTISVGVWTNVIKIK